MADSNSSNSRKSRPLPWVLFFISLFGCLVLGYLWYNASYKNGQSLKERNEALVQLLGEADITKDSLDTELNLTLSQYQDVLSELSLLKQENQGLIEDLENKKIQIRRLISRPSDPKALLEAKAEIERLKKELVFYRVQVDTLSRNRDLLAEKYEKTVGQFDQVKEEVKKTQEEKEDLYNRLKLAKLRASSILVTPRRTKRGQKVPTTKASKVEDIKFQFTILGGELIEKGEKELSLRLLGVNGEVLGADNDDALINSDQLVSMQEILDYNGEDVIVTFDFSQKADYNKGQHIVEVLSDGELVTRTMFKLE
jgi:hypothetical protein